jgi:hypothetical protein
MGYAPDLWNVDKHAESQIIETVAAINAGKPFLVLTVDSEIFHTVYDLLRHVRRALNNWTSEDEQKYIETISKWGR